MAFDFEGLKQPKENSGQETKTATLPMGVKPFDPDTSPKADGLLSSVPSVVRDALPLFTTIPSVVSVGDAILDDVKQTNAYKKYMYSDEQKLSEAKNISIETGIPENVLIASDDNLAKGREMFNFRRKQMALAPQGINDFDINQIYDSYPALKGLENDTDMAIGFSHIENIKQTHGIVEAAKVGFETAKLMRQYSSIGNKAVYGGTLTDEDWQKAQDVNDKLQNAKFFPDISDNPLENIIGNTVQQAYRYGPSVAKGIASGVALGTIGATAGATAGVPGAIAGAKYGFGLGMKIGIAADMFDEVAGSRFMEYASLIDKNGNRLINDDDARLFTIIEAGAETGIEFWNYDSILGILGGSAHKKAIKEIVANAAGSTEAVKAGVLGYAKMIAANSAHVFAEEIPEEAAQDAVEKGMWNFITGSYAKDNNYKQYSPEEMKQSAIGAMEQAVPSVIGFSAMAGASSSLSSVRSFARMADLRQKYTEAELQTMNGVDMIANLQENKTANELYKKQPGIYEKVLHNELSDTDYAQTRIDTELALADESTAKVFYQLAQEAGLEEEEVKAIVSNGADLVVPTELYTSKVDSGSKMNEFIKFGEGTESIARQTQMKEIYQKELESFVGKEEGKQADIIDALVAAAFPNEGEGKDMGAQILLSYPQDPASGWKAEYNAVKTSIDSQLEPIYLQLDEKGKNVPNSKEKRQEIAIDVAKGNGAKYGVSVPTVSVTEALQSDINKKMVLEGIKDTMLNLSRTEMGVMKGLSKEAIKVYQSVASLAPAATSKKAGQSIKTTAILLARHADRIAEIARASGIKDFTAEDYVKGINLDFSGQGDSLFKGQTVNQAGKNNLVAIHNLSIENLLHSNKMGGIAVPSVAITNIEHPLENFGEITMIGDTDLINPSSSKNKVFNADVYSPRYPEVITDVDSKKIDGYADEVKQLADYKKIYQYRKPSVDDLEEDAKGGTRKLVYSTLARLMYASRNGLSIDADHKAFSDFMEKHQDGFNAFLEDFLNDVSKGEKIFKGFTNLGNRRYIPHTLENVVKELTKSLQDGEGFNYGLGSLRSVVAKRYKTLKEIQKDRDKIISKEDFNKAKEVLQKEFDEITTEAINKYTHENDFNTIDNFMDILKEGIKRNNIEKELHDFGFEGMDINRIRAFLNAIKNFPTEYFEAKIQRAVGINEFSGAVIPKNSSQKVRDILKENGVPFQEYEEGQRQNVVQSFSNELNEQTGKRVLFQQNQSNGITQTPAFKKWFKNSKVADKNGKPIIVYHGTAENFTAFDENKIGANYSESDRGGFFFTQKKHSAESYAFLHTGGKSNGNTMSVYLNIKNPLIREVNSDYVNPIEFYDMHADELIIDVDTLGYDGIIIKGTNNDNLYVAFSPTQIKSVDNAGTFDENNANIYNQSIKGSTTFLQSGERIIRLFETADQSTFVHELGHNFLADIIYWGKQETAPAWLKKDYATIAKYINYDGINELSTEQHEKFARGFEAYLRNGEAPIKGLRGVFRKFKQWLVGIYNDYKELGGIPSDKVMAVMDRMLVSEQEVEDEAKLQQYNNGLKQISKIVSTSDSQMYARWQSEAKEEAKEKTLALAMKEIEDASPEKRTEAISQYEKTIREKLSQQDIFKVEAILKNNNDLSLLPDLGYTEESYREGLKNAGGGLEQAVKSAVEAFAKDYDSTPVNKDAIRAQAENSMREGSYNDMLVGFELEAMKAKEEASDLANDKAVKQIEAIIRNMKGEANDNGSGTSKPNKLKQDIANLRYSYRWTLTEERMIQDGKLAELKQRIKDKKTQVRVLKQRVQASVSIARDVAKERLSNLPLSEVVASRMWINQGKRASKNALDAIKKENWSDALRFKQQELMYAVMASESIKAKEFVSKTIARQQKRSSNVINGKARMPVNERYYFNHLLYVFGINKNDAKEPIEGAESFLSLVKRFSDDYEANFTDENGNVGIPNWVLSAIGSNEVYGGKQSPSNIINKKPTPARGYEALKMQDFKAISDLASTIYTVGKNANKLRTVKTIEGESISLEDAVKKITDAIGSNVKAKITTDITGATQKSKIELALEKAGDLNMELVKMETIFDQIDGGKENGPAMSYLYNIANEARRKEKELQISTKEKIRKLFGVYSNKEARSLLKDKKYKFGTSLLTKEQVISLALNSGTEINKKRILDGYHVSEKELMDTLKNLDDKDWSLVHGVWNLFNSYWADTVGVEERMTGSVLVKQDALPFEIEDNEGNTHKVDGGYYPIQYDPTKSVRAAEQKEDDIAKQLHNDNAVFGTRIGFTKNRSKNAEIVRPVFLTFSVIPKALDNVIHNIAFRESVRDMNRIVTNKDFQAKVVESFGINTYRLMKQWVKDNWAQERKYTNGDKMMAFLRRNITSAILGWRVSTSLLNVLNIAPMSEYLGVARAGTAIKDFYSSPVKNREFIFSKSVYMADRVSSMDRDQREVIANVEQGSNPISKFIKNESFRVISETDLMLANPLWLSEYQRVFQEGVKSKADVETIEKNAIMAGDKAVRRVFGSGEIQDLSNVQKSSELMKALTMFYSYFNVVFNALSKKNRTGSRYDLARSFLYWIILPSVGEQIIRAAIKGDDGDDEDWAKRFAWGLSSNAIGMIPVARDGFMGTIDMLFDRKSFNSNKVSSVYDAFIRFQKAVKTGMQVASGEQNKDWIDLLRESTKATNAITGTSDTATDAAFTTLRYIDSDFDAEIGEYLKAIAFDKKLE